MKNNKKRIIPKLLDQRLRLSFRLILISRMLRASRAFWTKKFFRVSLVAVCVSVLMVSVNFFQGSSARYIEAAVNYASLDIELQDELIKHQKITYREGSDKISFAQRLEYFDPTDGALRSESIERWQHGNHSLAVVTSALSQKKPKVHLNYESDKNIHVFQYQPEGCMNDSVLPRGPEECQSEPERTIKEKEIRTLLDSVHNLDILYADVATFLPGQNAEILNWVQSMDYLGLEKKKRKSSKAIFRVRHTEELFSILTFDAESGILLERAIFVVTPDQSYEMAVVEYGNVEWIAPEKATEIFNPEAHSFEQVDLVPLG